MSENQPIILTTREKHRTWDNKDFEVSIWNGPVQSISDIERFKNILNQRPVLYTGAVKIELDNQTVESKGKITVLMVHGRRDERGKHFGFCDGKRIPSFDIVNSIVRDREKDKDLQRIKLFVSCDENGKTRRWDEGRLGSLTGVIGFSGGLNFYTFDEKGNLIIQAQGLRTPFHDPNHPNAWLTDPRHSVFKVTKIKI